MPIPDFDEHGLLPASVHDCILAEIAARFGVFQGNEQRPRLMVDLLVAREGSVEYGRWVEFFQQVRLEPAATKGILRLRI